MSWCQVNSGSMSSTPPSNVHIIFDFQKLSVILLHDHFPFKFWISFLYFWEPVIFQLSDLSLLCTLILIMSEAFSLSVCWKKTHRCSFFQHALIFECLYPGSSPAPSCTKLFSVQWQGLIHSVPSQMFYSFSESFYDWFSNQISLGRGESVLWLYPLANIWLYLFLQNISPCIWTGLNYPFQYKQQNTEANFICIHVDLIGDF